MTWTLMYTSVTRTTSYGYATTCTLADAMANRARNETHAALTNLADGFGALGYWLRCVAAASPTKTSKPRARRR